MAKKRHNRLFCQDTVELGLALCLRDEIHDYQQAGITIVQVDEPAFREKAPIKRNKWGEYFDWAVNAFNCAIAVAPSIQVHTHMCYSSFGEIIEQINRMDFDVISIEASRSDEAILRDFTRVPFGKQIGLGVWDIHSPVVPSREKMVQVVEDALNVFDKEQVWINPDCGLKTRAWPEVRESLAGMVAAAAVLRERHAGASH